MNTSTRNEVRIIKFFPGEKDSWVSTHPNTGGIIIAHREWEEKGGKPISEGVPILAVLHERKKERKQRRWEWEKDEQRIYYIAFPNVAQNFFERAAELNQLAEELADREKALRSEQAELERRTANLFQQERSMAKKIADAAQKEKRLAKWEQELAAAQAEIDRAHEVFVEAVDHIDFFNRHVPRDKRIMTERLLDEFPNFIQVPNRRANTKVA